MRRTRHYLNRRTWAAGALSGALVLLCIVAACGTSASSQGPGATTPLPTQNCGTLHSNYAGLMQADKAVAQQDETCFFNAYKQCHPATLIYESFGLDAGSINHLAVKSANGSCSLADGVQHYIAPNPPRGTITYACASASMQADGLHIASCGDAGDVLVPLK
jgi:hypothetical protein